MNTAEVTTKQNSPSAAERPPTCIFSIIGMTLNPWPWYSIQWLISYYITTCPVNSIKQHLSYDDCLEDNREDYQNCYVLYCVTQLHTIIHTDISSSYRWTVLQLGFVCFTGVGIFVLGLVISGFVYFLFVIVWLSVPVKLIHSHHFTSVYNWQLSL